MKYWKHDRAQAHTQETRLARAGSNPTRQLGPILEQSAPKGEDWQSLRTQEAGRTQDSFGSTGIDAEDAVFRHSTAP